jgi:transcriptional regulator with XRE-family HTH domain
MSEQDQKLAALGRAVRQVREECRMSAATLAAATGIDQEHLDEIEAARARHDLHSRGRT